MRESSLRYGLKVILRHFDFFEERRTVFEENILRDCINCWILQLCRQEVDIVLGKDPFEIIQPCDK